LTAPISIKLRCASWAQLASIYKRDLSRSAIFLRSASPPPIGTPVRIDLTLPSDSMVVLSGVIQRHVRDGDPDPAVAGRGAGIDVHLNAIPQSAMWLIETALASSAAQKEATQKQQQQRAAVTPAPQLTRPPTHDSGAHREAALSEGSDLAAAETELIVALTSELDSLKRLNPFQVLGLGYEASDADVRAAFGELTKRYHPDRYARFQSTDLRHLAAEIFILIRDAYRRLGDETSRAQVVSQLGRRAAIAIPPLSTVAERPGPAPQHRPPVPMQSTGPTLGGRNPVVRVPEPPAPMPPVGAAPTAGGDLAMAESMLDSGKYDEAMAFFRIIVRKNPNDRQAKAGIELAEGLRALSARDRLEAAQRFEAVLELDPANERAARELAEMRRLATNERKGMLSRLLGKKE
jgi:tetratricopeptide (TPR) repeat protein